MMMWSSSVIAALAAVILAGCAREPEPMVMASAVPPRVITKTVTKEVRVDVPVCPTDDQLRDSAIEVSVATYRNAPGGSRACACPTDTYKRLGIDMSCGGNTAIQAASWVMCSREQVPQTIVANMRAKLPGCTKALG